MTATRLFDRAVIRLAPRQADESVADFLQGLVTNTVKGLLPVYAGLLTPQGKTLFDFLVWPGAAGELLIDCEAEAAEDLVRRLSLYRLRRPIDIAIDPAIGVHWRPEMGDGGAADPRLGALGQRWLAPVDDSDEAADAVWRHHRLSLGVPEGRAELGDILWLETNAIELNGVDFSKGCYIGQENTARMNWRSKINRRLVVVPLAKSDEKRRKIAYADKEVAIDHLRTDAIDPDMAPVWLKEALAES
ncbi:folate-binding protein [Qipengyuania sp. XHP0207]|uniref:CAF17-like 4Fe-4S cluster assembly/insertion protein YgfZ n=1 Tax=Qipengyuania sp. XHP0207 TaxID=3038078 RepID=UPI00241F21B6|nr:folate-binding protein [Qipengyuania sp. XHP0207]MDG5748754.1 folate-binding protein [Qipengyuania sp. XHP0207]